MHSNNTVSAEKRLEDPGMLGYVVPADSNYSIDMMCIPANVQNVEGAELFINYMYDPEIALANTTYVGYSSPNTAAIAQLPEEIRTNKNFYPDKATFDTLEIYYTSGSIDSTYDAIWQQILAN